MGKGLEGTLLQNRYKMANKHMKRSEHHYREKNIKTTMRYHSMPIRTAIYQKKKKQTNKERKITSVGEDMEKSEYLFTAVRNIK